MNNIHPPAILSPASPQVELKWKACFFAIFILFLGTPYLLAQQDAPVHGQGGEPTIGGACDGVDRDGANHVPGVTAGGRRIYVVSERPDGSGGHDFWYITRENRQSCTYTSPRNIGSPGTTSDHEGAPVNSTFTENTPFLLPGGQIRYFSSKREGSIGGSFISRLGTDGRWMLPEPLADPINSVSNERLTDFPDTVDLIYFTSGEEEEIDIFMGLGERIGTLLVRGRVYDRQSGRGLQVNLIFTDAATGDTIHSTATDASTGGYEFFYTAGESRTIEVRGASEGYEGIRKTFAVEKSTEYRELEVDVPLGTRSAVSDDSLPKIGRLGLEGIPNGLYLARAGGQAVPFIMQR